MAAIVVVPPGIGPPDRKYDMDELKSVSVGALAVGELLLRINSDANVGELGWALGTHQEWADDPLSKDPEWRAIWVSASQVLAFRFRS